MSGALVAAMPQRTGGNAEPPHGRIKEFSDIVFEFELKDGQVVALKQRSPSGEQRIPKI